MPSRYGFETDEDRRRKALQAREEELAKESARQKKLQAQRQAAEQLRFRVGSRVGDIVRDFISAECDGKEPGGLFVEYEYDDQSQRPFIRVTYSTHSMSYNDLSRDAASRLCSAINGQTHATVVLSNRYVSWSGGQGGHFESNTRSVGRWVGEE